MVRKIESLRPTVRAEHIEPRLTPDALAVLRRAAELQGRSVSDFMFAAARAEAERTIESAQIIRLSQQDQIAFAEAVLAPPPPNCGAPLPPTGRFLTIRRDG